MMTRSKSRFMLMLVITLAAVLGIGWIQPKQRNVWEYRHLDISSSPSSEWESVLNREGLAGWELIAIDDQDHGRVQLVFKRER
jgi:hypothetical protein